MRISDWSSDVCSSDLLTAGGRNDGRRARARRRQGQDQARGAAVLRVAFLRVVARLAVFVALAAFAGAFFFAAVSLRTADLRNVALRPPALRAGDPPWWLSSAEIGRASGRARVCADVVCLGGAGAIIKKTCNNHRIGT